MSRFDRIALDHGVMGGGAGMGGMRIFRSVVASPITYGADEEGILDGDPNLEPEGIHHALKYAA